MNGTHVDWVLLARYLAGEASADERDRVDAWVKADPSRADSLEKIRCIWAASEEQAADEGIDAGELAAHWRDVLRRTKDHRDAAVIIPLRRDAKLPPKSTKRQRPKQWLRIAAMLLAVVGGALVVQQVIPNHDDDAADEVPLFREIVTKRGQQAGVQLTDGTEVILNASSTLRIPSTFNVEAREVHLQGEAYFDVEYMADRDFTVRTGDAVTQALGTSFNVRAYPEDVGTEVVVAGGSVSLRRADLSPRDTVLLRPKQLGRITEQRRATIQRRVRLDQYLGWTEGRLVFARAPFEEIASRLERRFDIDIELQGSSSMLPRLNASFEDESVGEILKTIAAALNLKYEWRKRQVTFYSERP